MSQMVLHCPHCGQSYKMAPDQMARYAGKTITCRNCRQPFSFDTALASARPAAEGEGPAAAAAPAPASSPAPSAPPADFATAPAAPAPGYAGGAPGAPAGGYGGPPGPEAGYAQAGYVQPGHAPPGYTPPAYSQPAYSPPPQPAYPDPAQAAAPTPPAPMNYATPRPSSGRWTWGDFFAFRRMITPVVIQVLFWIGVVFCLLGGIGVIYSSFNVPNYSYSSYNPYGGYSTTPSTKFSAPLFLTGLAYLVLGPVIVRIYCELLIVFFRMNETLTDIKNTLDDRRP